MSARLETIFVKTKYIKPPIASLLLIFSNCFSFLTINLAVKQNLKGIKNKKVLINSKLKRIFYKFKKILFQARIKFKAKPLSFQDKAFRSQQN